MPPGRTLRGEACAKILTPARVIRLSSASLPSGEDAMTSEADPLVCSAERYRAYLLALARMRLSTWQHGRIDPSDLVQQTLLKAHRKREQFRGQTEGEWRAWLR